MVAPSWESFKRSLDRAYPKKGTQFPMTTDEDHLVEEGIYTALYTSPSLLTPFRENLGELLDENSATIGIHSTH